MQSNPKKKNMKAQNFACSCILALYGRLLSKSANARTEALVPAVQSSIWRESGINKNIS